MSDHTHPRIDAFLDGELTAAEAARAEGHVQGCVGCRRDLAMTRLLDEALVAPAAAVPARFVRTTRALALRRWLPEAPLWWVALPAPWRVGFAALLLLAAVGGVRLGETVTADRANAAELAAALATPVTDAMLSPSGAEVRP